MIIIGAGASGIAAAYEAIMQNNQLNILVLEKEANPGRKLSAAGNGKCNVTNAFFKNSCYHTKTPSLVDSWIQTKDYQNVIGFFESAGILLYENEGYYYPVSNQGKQVTRILVERCKNLGVTFQLQTKVIDIKHTKKGYEVFVDTQENAYQGSCVIVAMGGTVAPKLGGSQDGYTILKRMGHSVQPTYSALSPIYVKEKGLRLAKGVRLNANVTLELPEYTVSEYGQVQFNENSLSGIVVMNLSCYYNGLKKEQMEKRKLYLDVLPDYNWDEVYAYFIKQKEQFSTATMELTLNALFPNPFVQYMMKELSIDKTMTLQQSSEKLLRKLVSTIKKLSFTPVVFDDKDKSQVTGGGVSLTEVDLNTFESKQHKDLYITGELLDVTGKCGGYNITFAVLSGIAAARECVKRIQK